MRTDRSPAAGTSEPDAAIPGGVESQQISGAECGEVEDLAEKNGGDAGDPVSLNDCVDDARVLADSDIQVTPLRVESILIYLGDIRKRHKPTLGLGSLNNERSPFS